jgi:hypothetical protein
MPFPRPTDAPEVINRFVYEPNYGGRPTAYIIYPNDQKDPAYSAVTSVVGEMRRNFWGVEAPTPIYCNAYLRRYISHEDLTPEIVNFFNDLIEEKLGN